MNEYPVVVNKKKKKKFRMICMYVDNLLSEVEVEKFKTEIN